MIIKNREKIVNSYSRNWQSHVLDILDILTRGVESVLPQNVMQQYINRLGDTLVIGKEKFSLNKLNNVFLIGAGKAVLPMADPIIGLLGDKIRKGILIAPHANRTKKKKYDVDVEVFRSSHPLPGKSGQKATEKIIRLAEKASEGDLVISLISGGGSALLTQPVREIDIEDLNLTTETLIESGATIEEINVVRKHLSRVKGGKLARKIHPAKCRTLIISDVVGDRLGAIASGPTAPDSSTFRHALNILNEYGLLNEVPNSVHGYLHANANNNKKPVETVSENEFSKLDVKNLVVANNLTSIQAMHEEAINKGLNSIMLSSMIEGESYEVGKVHAGIAMSVIFENIPIQKPGVIFSGGETTVTLDQKNGRGGPNQEFVLSVARHIQRSKRVLAAAIDTDGKDGGTSTAGGVIQSGFQAESRKVIQNALKNHCSSKALQELGQVIKTGSTGTNVNDVRLILIF